MRRALLLCAAIAFAIACGDNITEPIPDRTQATPPVAFATTTTEDGLSISTDKDDYQPGDTVHFTGSGWQPGDVLDIVLTDEPLTHDPLTWTVNVEADGMFHDSTYVVDVGDLNVAFTLVATSRATGRSLTVQFTDAELLTAELVGVTNDVTVTQGSSANFTINLTASGAIKCAATALNPATAKVHTVFSISGGGVLSSSTLSGAFNFFGGAPINATNCNITWTGAPTAYTAAASVSAAAATPVGNYTITLRSSAANVVLTNPAGSGGNLADDIATTITVHVVAPANVAPNAPATLAQFRSNGTTSIPTGGATNETSVVLKGLVSDPDAGNTVKLQVEVQPVGTAFTNTSTAESALLTSGSTAAVTATGLTNGTSYHWQARAVDNSGAASGWVSFGGNLETAADFLVDTDAPGVTINQAAAQADPTNASPINFTVLFSKTVTDFATGGVTLSGTAGATTATVTGSGTTYNVAVSGMTGDGTVIASIAAAVASDAAGNDNVASTSTDNTVTYDKTKPTITINQAATQADPTNASPISFTVEFSEIVTGFATGDVTLSGTAGATTATVSGSGTTYNVAVTGMTTDGTVIASIAAGVATDGATNTNVVSTSTDNSVTYDKTPPTVTINQAAAQADPTKVSPINFTVVFNETVTDFATGDVTLSGTAGATTATVTGSGMTYNVAVSGMTSSGTVIASIAAGVATDAAGNGNAAATHTDNSVTYDPEPPVVSDVAVNPNPTNGSIDVTAKARVDDAATGHSKIVSAAYSIDGGGPIAMDPEDGTFDSETEDVTATILAATVAALPEGTHTICVQGTDEADNTSLFSATDACVTLTIDKTPPKVTINQKSGQADPTNASPINFTVVFDETVSDFATGDVTLSGTAGATTAVVSGSGMTYNVEVSGMTGTGTVIATVATGVAHDAAGNGNEASTSTDNTVIYDITPPKVTINQKFGQADPTNASPINFTVVFDEPVNDFATGDVTLSGGTGATTATVTGSGTTYNVAVSGMTTDGTVTATIAAGVAHDAAGNGNEASTSTDNTVTYDTTPPAISNLNISPNPVAVNTSFTISATFTDALSFVTGAEYSLNGTAGPWAPLPAAGSTAPYGDSKTENGSVTITQPNADVLDVCVLSTDQALNTNQVAGTNPIQCVFLAVYDPSAGFVTGGGWINSPAGAYPADASLVGKANFGFVSKYLKGANTPTGNTEFQFHAGSLNFSSTVYDWLVVQGSTKASYKGSGTVNGASGYGFLLSVVDGGSAGDKFRMKIWNKATSVIVYDNQLSAVDDATASQLIGGGSIVIHTNGGLANK